MPNKNKTPAGSAGRGLELTFISFAQNFEDVMLWRALGHIEHGFYIDIGAWSPEINSVTKAFYDRGWSGINVEPNPEPYTELRTARPRDINLQIAVADADGAAELHIIRLPTGSGSTGLSTLGNEIAAEHTAKGLIASEQLLVQTSTLASICAEHIREKFDIHFLKIDVEGAEASVIRGADWVRYRPWIVIVEATYPMSQIETHATWEQILIEADYTCVYRDGLNGFYIAREHAELASAFDIPPNVFDRFVPAAQSRAETRISELVSQVENDKKASLQQVATIDALRQDIQGLSDTLHAMESSWSWRLTRPFRSIRAAVLRGKQMVGNSAVRCVRIFNWWQAVLRPDADMTPRARLIHQALTRAIARRRVI